MGWVWVARRGGPRKDRGSEKEVADLWPASWNGLEERDDSTRLPAPQKVSSKW